MTSGDDTGLDVQGEGDDPPPKAGSGFDLNAVRGQPPDLDAALGPERAAFVRRLVSERSTAEGRATAKERAERERIARLQTADTSRKAKPGPKADREGAAVDALAYTAAELVWEMTKTGNVTVEQAQSFDAYIRRQARTLLMDPRVVERVHTARAALDEARMAAAAARTRRKTDDLQAAEDEAQAASAAYDTQREQVRAAQGRRTRGRARQPDV